jgi:protein-disulfide isomerase
LQPGVSFRNDHKQEKGWFMKKMMKQWLPAALLAMSFAGVAAAQTSEVETPKPQAGTSTGVAPTFPAANPKNFTATSPTTDEVNSFLKAIWGYDENRKWEVAAILKTSAPGVAKVVVFVGEVGQAGAKSTTFFTTPDGKHAIADQVIDFGAKPFEADRKVLQDRADGPATGAAGKSLMLVEFADLQCPHCKEAQDTMTRLAQDFPQARIVYQNFPLSEIHPYAFRAAAEGVCVRKAKGDAAFFTYASAVYAKQESLTPELADKTLGDAVKAAGGDPAAAATCAATDATKQAVTASIDLGKEVGVDQTPVLFINGHLMPINALPYETLRKIIAYQANLDGVTIHLQPMLGTLK